MEGFCCRWCDVLFWFVFSHLFVSCSFVSLPCVADHKYRVKMSDHCYGLCDTDSSDEEPVGVGGVSVEVFRSHKQRRGADAAS
jgi:hypothetical protein